MSTTEKWLRASRRKVRVKNAHVDGYDVPILLEPIYHCLGKLNVSLMLLTGELSGYGHCR